MRLRLNDYPLWKNSTLNTCGSQLDDREHVQFIICLLGAILCCTVLSVYHFLECYDFFKISQLRSLSIWLCLYYTSLCIPNLVIKDKFIFIYCIKLFPVYTTFWFLFSLHAEIYWFFVFILPIVLLYMGYVFYNFVVDFRGRV